MTDQELFDKVAAHLLLQGDKSMNGEACAYRGEYGMMCAIGCLIPNEKYSEDFEGISLDDDEDGMVRRAAGLDDYQLDLAMELQYIHDQKDPDEWKDCLNTTAREFKLSDTVLETMEP